MLVAAAEDDEVEGCKSDPKEFRSPGRRAVSLTLLEESRKQILGRAVFGGVRWMRLPCWRQFWFLFPTQLITANPLKK